MGIVELHNIVKKFGDFVAVDKINIDIKEGEIYGILGPNGAGKTTAINMILGLLDITEGSISINHLDIKKNKSKIKRMIGFMTQETVVDQDLTARDNLRIIAELYHLSSKEVDKRVEFALEESELTKFSNVKAGTFSMGMQRRLNLVKSMMHSPKILILDEPTTGLDVQNRLNMWKRIRYLNKKNITIILTTQYLEEADALCDRISIIDHGKIVAAGTPSELKKMVGSGDVLEISVRISDIEKIRKLLKTKFGLESGTTSDKITVLIKKDTNKILYGVIKELEKKKIDVISIGVHLPTLDDAFIKFTGSTLRDSLEEQTSSIDKARIKS